MKKKNMGGMTEQPGAPARANVGAPSFGPRREAMRAARSMPPQAQPAPRGGPMQPPAPRGGQMQPPAVQAAPAAPAMGGVPKMQTAMPAMKKGGMVCRGMGKAKRGGKFKG